MILQAIVVLLRVVGILLILRMVLRGLTGRPRGAPPRPAGPPPPSKAISDLVRDQVCNTFLPRERALRAVISGREEHFCSSSCRDRAISAASEAS